jgi:hypothetical protein
VAIIASGYSTKLCDLNLLRGRARVIAIKENIEKAPWADAIYGCDGAWWRYRLPMLTKYNGMKICWSGSGLGNQPGMIKVDIVKPKKGSLYSDDLSFGTDKIGGGGNSGFQALNLAINWGAGILHPIILIGFDLHEVHGKHWYGRNKWPMANNPDSSNFRRWNSAFEKAAVACKARGIKVLNASKGTSMRCFPIVTYEEVIEQCAMRT